MKVPLKWLSEYVDIVLPPEELARKLTLGAAEVEEIIRTGGDWDEKVRVGRVLKVEPHPNADRLRLVTVDLGGREQRVVCGAPNVAEGQRIAFGEEGAQLIDGHTGKATVLKPTPIRGVVSAGMVLSEKELGLSQEHEGILVLPGDAPIGTPLREYLGDAVFDLSSWANRPDLLSIIGVARDVAALTGQTAREPAVSFAEHGESAGQRLSVEIDDPDLSARYIGMVIEGVAVGPSPAWMQERLIAAGQRPINNIVDITNYVMLEYGQPLHAFDYDRVRGRKIIVRRARPGETLVTLDGEQRELMPDMLIIADAERPVALAGVMGGLDSEVNGSTTTVLLEAANFNNVSIRRTAFRLKLRSEASARFEKGLPPRLAEVAARRAAQLMAEIAGGKVAPGMVDAYPRPQDRMRVAVPAARLRQVLGIDIPPGRVRDVLTALGFEVHWTPPDLYSVYVPYWRPDVRIPDDVAEELIRIVGYDDLPLTTIAGRLPEPLPQPKRDLRESVKDILTAAGMQEVMTYSLVSMEQLRKVVPPEELSLIPPLRVVNPLSAQHEYLRTSMRGSLLESLARSLRVRRGETALFETATTYDPRDGDLPDERETVVGVVGGRRYDRWGQPAEEAVDFYDAKGYIEALFMGLHLQSGWSETDEFGLLPGRTAAIRLGNVDVGVLGQVHPELADAFDIEGDCFLFELRLDLLVGHTAPVRDYRPYPTYPAVVQDLAVVVNADVPAAGVLAVIGEGRYVVSAQVFDEYMGDRVPPGKKSLAVAVTFQDPAGTLTDERVAGARRRVVAALENRLGATLRG
jgi:phenylalanyl-tRNA synthetase beta chain